MGKIKKIFTNSLFYFFVFFVIAIIFGATLSSTYSYFTSNKIDTLKSKVATVKISLSPSGNITDTYLGQNKTYDFKVSNDSDISTVLKVYAILEWQENGYNKEDITLSRGFKKSGDYFYLIDYLSPNTDCNFSVNIDFNGNKEYIGQEYELYVYTENLQATTKAIMAEMSDYL